MAQFCRTLLGCDGAVLLRLEDLEIGAAPNVKLAPIFRLPGLDGEVLGLLDPLAEGRPALVAFISPTCVMCGESLRHLERGASFRDPLAVVLSTGTVAVSRAKVGQISTLRMVLQDDWEIAHAH